MVKWPLALFGQILGFAGFELRVFGEGGFFFLLLQVRLPVAYGFMIHKDDPGP